MSDFFTKLEDIIVSKIKEPTIINKDSDFVVVTYWWGYGNKNANIARPCMLFYETYIKRLISLVTGYIGMILKQNVYPLDDQQQLLDNMRYHLVQIESYEEFIKRTTKEYINSVYVDLDLLDDKDPGRFNCAKSILKEMKRSLTSPSNYSLFLESVDENECKEKVYKFLNEISSVIVDYLKEDIYTLYYEKASVKRLKEAYEKNEITTEYLLEITKELLSAKEEIDDKIKKALKFKTTFIVDDNQYDNMNIYDILNENLRFREARFYQDMITNWENECSKNNCNYLAIEYPEFAAPGGYQMAINAKPLFIRHALDMCKMGDKQRTVVYIDGDMFIRQYPHIFDMKNIDFMSRGWNMDPRASYNIGSSIYYDPYKFETSGGIMYFSQSPEAEELLNLWIDESSRERNKGKADDRIISLVFNTKKMLLNMNIIQLPVEYLWLTLDYDERMLEYMYDWDKEEMESTIFIEHPECLTSEETAEGAGASSNRQPKFYDFLDAEEDSMPVSEHFYEFLAFPNKLMAKQFKRYFDYMRNTQYINDGNPKLLELNFVDPENEENNDYPLYINSYDEGFGDRNSIVDNNLDLADSILSSINFNMFKSINNGIDDIVILCDIDILKVMKDINLNVSISEMLLPTVIALLEKGYKVIYRPQNCSPECYVDLISKKSSNLDLVLIPELDKMVNMFKPSIDLKQPIYFNKTNEHSLITKVLSMFVDINEMSSYLNYGSYQIVSRIRMGYVYKRSGYQDLSDFALCDNIEPQSVEFPQEPTPFNIPGKSKRNPTVIGENLPFQEISDESVGGKNKKLSLKKQRGGVCLPCAMPLVVGAVGVGAVGYGMSKKKKSKKKKFKKKK